MLKVKLWPRHDGAQIIQLAPKIQQRELNATNYILMNLSVSMIGINNLPE
jgi:hypothetical protein